MNESHLTGESVAVTKHTRALHGGELPLGDRANLVFMGTTVMTGHAWAVVSETGMETELGRIAHLRQTVEEHKTPLQIRLAYLGKWLAAAVLAMTAVIFVAGLLRGEPIELMLLTAISLAVAVIPEGLPAVVTIVLALGAQRDYLWSIGLFSNPKLMGAVLLTIVLQMAITYSPPLQPIFHTTALSLSELAACIVVSSTVFVAVEGEKWLRYRRKA